MLFLVLGIILFSALNVLGYRFVAKAATHISIEKKVELSTMYSELNKYFVSSIVVFAVFVLFFLKKLQLDFVSITTFFFLCAIVFIGVLGYWLLVELKRRQFSAKAIQFMLISNGLKNIGFFVLIYGIAQFLAKLK
ncbi:MAG: hypothetical protein WCR55_09830 [Lentisphaerota bacterium]